MKLQFKEQGFQIDAINAVCSLFEGQQQEYSPFTVLTTVNMPLQFVETSIINKLTISKDEIIKNMHTVQAKNHLPCTAGR